MLDANILIYAHNPKAPEHRQVREWLEGVLSGHESVALPWITIWAFIRITTNRHVNPRLQSSTVVFRAIEKLIGHPSVRLIQPGPRHLEILERHAIAGQAFGGLITDATLAALATEYGASLASTDTDFARFTDLKWINPLS